MVLLYVLARDPLTALYSKNSPLLSDFYYAIIPLTLFTMGWTIFELYTYQLLRVAVPKGIKEVLLRLLQLAVYLLYAFGYIDFPTMVWGFLGRLCDLGTSDTQYGTHRDLYNRYHIEGHRIDASRGQAPLVKEGNHE